MSMHSTTTVVEVNDLVELAPHPTARHRALVRTHVLPGTVLLTVSALATALLPSEKGSRCDHCHRLGSASDISLRRCSGCASYWYCGPVCQNAQWSAHHKKICRVYNARLASPEFQPLAAHERIDALLLSHLVAGHTPAIIAADPSSNHDGLNDPISTLLSLLPGPAPSPSPPLCFSSRLPADALNRLHTRAANNHFVLHSHLSAFAHGVFPLASRALNHSCVPSAAPRYILAPEGGLPPRMEVVALRTMEPGDEITIPYLDPALPFQTRQQTLQITYGFECTCDKCAAERARGAPMAPPSRPSREASELDRRLCDLIVPQYQPFGTSATGGYAMAGTLPSDLLSVLHESYRPALSEAFSKASHEGPLEDALLTGRALLALNAIVYPLNYPQIGMHALEVAKSAWNGVVTAVADDSELLLRRQCRDYLKVAKNVLQVYGREGDEGGPMDEIAVLEDLLAER